MSLIKLNKIEKGEKKKGLLVRRIMWELSLTSMHEKEV